MNNNNNINNININQVSNEVINENNDTNMVEQPQQKKGPNKLLIAVIIGAVVIVILLSALAIVYFTKPKTISNTNVNNKVNTNTNNTNNTNKTNTDDPNGTEKPTIDNKNDNLSISQAIVNGVTISFPCTKEAFNGTGWTWDEKYANKNLKSGYTTSGGRIGTSPGGVVVSVVNNSGEEKKIEDCTIDSGTFYNPSDGSSDVTFIGGLNYNSTESEVQEVMKQNGYSNPKINSLENANYYKYFLNDDPNDYRNYVEFYYFNGVIKSVTIAAAE